MSIQKHRIATDPACMKALTRLEQVTTIDEIAYTGWLQQQISSLQRRFMFSAEPDDQAGAWCRFEYVRALGRIP